MGISYNADFRRLEAYLRENLDKVKAETWLSFKDDLEEMTIDDVLQKARRGYEEHGGTFKLSTFPALQEGFLESVDRVVYEAIADLQDEG